MPHRPNPIDPARINRPARAIACLIQGLRILARPELRHFVWIPLILNLVLYAGGFWIVGRGFDTILTHLLPAWLGWLHAIIWPIVMLGFVGMMFLSFTLLANLIGAPLYGALAEKVASLHGFPPSPARADGAPSPPLDSVREAIHRLRYALVRLLPAAVLFLIPGINLAAPLVWLALGGWFLALEYLSYPLEQMGVGFAGQRLLLSEARLAVLAFGATVALGLTVPVLNVLIPQAAVAGAVLFIRGAARA